MVYVHGVLTQEILLSFERSHPTHVGDIKGFPLQMNEGGCSVLPHNEGI